jgi:methylmalonyl-CoA/ethylmalonyl-CoA epimerase
MEKLTKIEHIGIAVSDLDKSEKLYETLLGTAAYKREEVASEGVITSFFKSGPNKVELLQATRPDSAIAKFIDRRGEGLHHIAFAVVDIYAEMERLRAAGFRLLNAEPKSGADGKIICFIHPKDSNGVLIELCQDAPKPGD